MAEQETTADKFERIMGQVTGELNATKSTRADCGPRLTKFVFRSMLPPHNYYWETDGSRDPKVVWFATKEDADRWYTNPTRQWPPWDAELPKPLESPVWEAGGPQEPNPVIDRVLDLCDWLNISHPEYKVTAFTEEQWKKNVWKGRWKDKDVLWYVTFEVRTGTEEYDRAPDDVIEYIRTSLQNSKSDRRGAGTGVWEEIRATSVSQSKFYEVGDAVWPSTVKPNPAVRYYFVSSYRAGGIGSYRLLKISANGTRKFVSTSGRLKPVRKAEPGK
jgi:hypothetical protein